MILEGLARHRVSPFCSARRRLFSIFGRGDEVVPHRFALAGRDGDRGCTGIDGRNSWRFA